MPLYTTQPVLWLLESLPSASEYIISIPVHAPMANLIDRGSRRRSALFLRINSRLTLRRSRAAGYRYPRVPGQTTWSKWEGCFKPGGARAGTGVASELAPAVIPI